MTRCVRQKARSFCRIFGVGVLVLGFALHVSAGSRKSVPTDRVRDTLESALRILNDPALQGPDKQAARRQAVRKLIADSFNYAEMAERSLDSHWVKLTAQQRQVFVDLFGVLFERSYSRMVLQSLPDQRIIYAEESVNGTRAIVKTVLVDKRGDRLPVDYQLQRPNGPWQMFDVIIDGVSIVSNYQSQFNKIIETSSFDELMRKMRIKREEE